MEVYFGGYYTCKCFTLFRQSIEIGVYFGGSVILLMFFFLSFQFVLHIC